MKDMPKQLHMHSDQSASGPVECLGMTFENDEKRRDYFLEKLREKLKDPEFRKIEGFPIGSDEDILALSDPPYYTACPNPFIADFITCYGKPYDPSKPYSREPFAADVSEGKNDPIYNAHSYHTKVPHKAIMRYILHYTEPGDIVFDGFSGTGMTGVAALLCGDKDTVESLGFKVDESGTIYQQEKIEGNKSEWKSFSKLGERKAVLNDLSPAATFIASNYNLSTDLDNFKLKSENILKELKEECGWMYETLHSTDNKMGFINYTIWSDVFICPECAEEVIFWEAAVDNQAGTVHDEFPCPSCNVLLSKRRMDRAWVAKFDRAIHQQVKITKQVPVLINYTVGNRRYEKKPDQYDLDLIEKIENSDIPYWFPTNPMMFKGEQWGDTWRAGVHAGITHIHHFYTKRNLWTLSCLWERLTCRCEQTYLRRIKFAFTAMQRAVSRLASIAFSYYFHGGGGAINAGTKGTLYVSSVVPEVSVFHSFTSRLQSIGPFFKTQNVTSVVETRSTGDITEEAQVDYIFTDPPFGGNLMYSELNFLWESWLKVFTKTSAEAIENQSQNKGLLEYQQLMSQCFSECFTRLKPGRWMTVEFHNSKNSVWNAIQESLQKVGFVIADVRTLDKKQGSFKQYTSAGAVKQDLVISAYKPNGGLEERFRLESGTEEGVWDFIRTHLKQLPVFVSKDGQAEVIAERQNFLLYDRMVAFHVQRGVTIPISAADFYAGLEQRFSERDGMYFLPEQVAEYDKKRMSVKEILQLDIWVKDEASAIQWLKQQITKKPQTFQELHPQFLKEIGGWQKHEKPLELSELLEQTFLRYDGNGDVPSQIHSYLSTNFKELRNLPKDDESLRSKAKDRWYVPDPNKANDLEKLREKSLLKEFDEYRASSQKRLKVFRLEAVRAGFKKAWQEKSKAGYRTIIEVARKIPENVLQEDPKLLMWYDQALTRVGECI